MDKKEQLLMIETQAKLETAFALLYSYYADKLPEYKHFWMELSADERTHSMMLLTFKSLVEEGKMVYPERRLSLSALRDNFKMVNAQIKFVQQHDLTIREALSTAMQFENLLLEKKVFEAEETDPPELKKTLQLLAEQTRAHYEKIKKLYDQLGHL